MQEDRFILLNVLGTQKMNSSKKKVENHKFYFQGLELFYNLLLGITYYG